MAIKQFKTMLKENNISLFKRLVYGRKIKRNGVCYVNFNGKTYLCVVC